jgi:hypothetical protein
MDYKKIRISDQNSKVLAFGFTKKHQFAAKIDRNYIFLGGEAHIPNRLYIMVH